VIGILAGVQAAAQTESTVQGEVRIDAFFADNSTVQGGGGGAWYLDRNVRLVLLAGAGSTFTGGVGEFSARADLLGRFVLDPDRTQKWALYGAGGIGLRYEAAPSWRGVLVALVGLEGPKWGHWTPFVEAGYGGGVQIGFGLRRARVRGR
jgi:hypothetical protein